MGCGVDSSLRLESMSNGLTKSKGVLSGGVGAEAAGAAALGRAARKSLVKPSSLPREGGVLVTGESIAEEM